jgi:glyoxylase-like metal-dependent hydrolase (beta-lactamase superfamily II)
MPMSMKKIEVPPEESVPLAAIADGLAGLRTLIVNLFAITDQPGWVLVDTGLRGFSSQIRSWAQEHVSAAPPLAIVLTHGHFDHVGSLGGLLEHWDVPVYAHSKELPFITGERAYPPPDPSVGGGLMARMSALYPRKPIDLGSRARPLPANGDIPGLPSWRWIATPGHSAGHVSLFRERDRTLVVGDAFCTTKQESFLAVAMQRPELHGPPAYFTTDWQAARESVELLAMLHPTVVAPGHGPSMSGEATAQALTALAERFDEVALPDHGEYVRRPPAHG